MRAMPKSVTLTVSASELVHDVGRLDVAVHDALPVRVGQRVGDARDDRQHLGSGSSCPSLRESTRSLPLRNSMAM